MTIYLIRHGKTEANEKRLYCGKTDLPLSETGRKGLLQHAYVPLENARYISSGLRRCNETLSLLFGDVSYDVIPELQEMDFGSFEMKGYEQLKEDPKYQVWITGDNEANVTPGGESGDQMKKRALAAFQAVREANRDTVIVTHGGVITAIMEELFPNENKNRYEWQPMPGCGYRLCGGHYEAIPEV